MARRIPTRRRYSDDDRANALAAVAANGGNVELTAAQLGIPESTLRSWVKGDRHPEAAHLCDEKKGPLADHLEAIAWRLADVLPDKLPAAGLQQVATSLGIVIDKMQLLREKPTGIHRTEGGDDDLRDLTDAELDRRLRAAVGRVEAPPPGGGGPDPGGDGPAAE